MPLPDDADARLIQRLEWPDAEGQPDWIGVAVSGGSDSLALLHLVAQLQSQRGGAVHAVTVDHRLRPEAAGEARFVAAICAGLGIPHDTLVWDHGAIEGNLQDQARRARYRLIGDWARSRGIADIALGHTADDQAETFLMELAREAGLDGLSGMRRVWSEEGVRWLRPCLAIPRAELRACLVRRGSAWVDDPSNADDRFTRVKARKALAALTPLGLSVEALSGVARNLASARQALQTLTVEATARLARTAGGEVIVVRRDFLTLPSELQRRFLIASLKWVSSAPYAPRQAALARLMDAIGAGRDATLWGCRIRVTGAELRITREPKFVSEMLSATDEIWDGRWRLSGPHRGGLKVQALGAGGLRQCEDWRATGLSRAALIVSPAIWDGDRLVAAPVAGLSNGWKAEIVADLASCVLSH